MKLSVEIKPDFRGSIAITDYSKADGIDAYIPEELPDGLIRYDSFKYSQTCTINILKYISVNNEDLLNVFYNEHNHETDSMRIPLEKDGMYAIYHIVIPTLEWLNIVKNEDLSEYNLIYVTDGKQIYKYFNGELYVANPIELIEVNSYNTTISRASFEIFSIDRLKHCYASVSRQILDAYLGKCASIDSSLKFNRDFLWMTINVISYYLEWGMYSEAQIVLEDMKCHQFCPDSIPFKNEHVSCGCKK